MKSISLLVAGIVAVLGAGPLAAPAAETNLVSSSAGWTMAAPRDEIKPLFRYDERGGKSGQGALVIAGDEREGLTGWWTKTFDIEGGQSYRFAAWRKTEGVAS